MKTRVPSLLRGLCLCFMMFFLGMPVLADSKAIYNTGSLYGELNHVVTFVIQDIRYERSVEANSFMEPALIPATALPNDAFLGWFTQPHGQGVRFNFEEMPIDRHMTLHAHYTSHHTKPGLIQVATPAPNEPTYRPYIAIPIGVEVLVVIVLGCLCLWTIYKLS